MDQKNSDKLFREKLSGISREPDPHVWDRIEASLDKRKSRRILPVWWSLGGAAAALILGLLLFAPWSDTELEQPAVTDTESQMQSPSESDTTPGSEPTLTPAVEEGVTDADPSDTSGPGTGEGSLQTGADALVSEEAEAADAQIGQRPGVVSSATQEVASSAQPRPQPESGLKEATGENNANAQAADKIPVGGENAAVAQAGNNESLREQPLEITEDSEQVAEGKSIFEAIAEAEEQPQPKEASPRWTVGPTLAPVYYNSFGDGSPIAQNFVPNSKSGSLNMSYGLSVAYEITKKLSVRSGLHRVDFGYNTNDVSFTSTLNAGPSSLIRTISYSENSRNLVVHSTAGGNIVESDLIASDVSAPSPERQGQMVQEFGYLEVPMEVQYSLIDKRLGLNIIGGMSSLFLVDNSVSLSSSGSSTEIGEATNMNSVNFSGNFGLGLYYQLNPTLQLNMQPMFKYHLNTFTETAGDFRPYSVGIYSGLSFRF